MSRKTEAALRYGHRAGSPDAFARLERVIVEWVSR